MVQFINDASKKQADVPASAPGASSEAPPKAAERRITHIVGMSIAILGCFLILVCAVSWSGLVRFQNSLNNITEDALPRVNIAAENTSRLSVLLVSMERLFGAPDEASAVKARKEIQRLYEQFQAVLSGPGQDETAVLPQLESVMKYMDTLSGQAARRLSLRVQMFSRLRELDELIFTLESQPDSATSSLRGSVREVLRGARADLLRLLVRVRWAILTEGAQPSGMLEHNSARELNVIVARLPANASDTRHSLQQARNLLLPADGLLPVFEESLKFRAAMERLHENSRILVMDMIDSQSAFFSRRLAESSDSGERMGRELSLFTQFFLLIALIALLLAAGMYMYFRRAFIIRLEKLNAALEAGVKGDLPPIDTRGADEIAGIARSVEHFARELKVSMQMAEASSKAKSDFLANMSHEIRTPMNAILGFARMAAETGDKAEQRSYVEKIENAARLLLGIFNDILDFSKIESGRLDVEPRPFALADVLDSLTVAYSGKAAAEGLTFTLTRAKDMPPRLVGDPVRIFQVLNNLCDNAVKFTEQGGIRVDVSLAGREEGRALVRFQVADDGIGMTPEQMEGLFEPFRQVDESATRRFGGTGLGLAIGSSLCALMKGELTMSSEYGKGSVFSFTLPLDVDEGDAGEEEREEDNDAPRLDGRRILLAEDNMINQEIILALLEKTGAELVLAGNGREAVDRLNAEHFDLVLMDIQMPELDGISATRIIRALADPVKAALPVIAMTAHAMDSDKQKCLEAGMNGHVAKPIDPVLLFDVLRRWLPA